MISSEAIYCLDTSALLFMADTYSADVFPDVWEQLAELVTDDVIMAPREVRRELEKKEDNGALSWVKANSTLLRDLDADQSRIVGEIVSSPQFHGLIDLDAEFPDADPFVVALAVTWLGRSGLFTEAPAVVGADASRVHVKLSGRLRRRPSSGQVPDAVPDAQGDRHRRSRAPEGEVWQICTAYGKG